jgi:hypothetical protein
VGSAVKTASIFFRSVFQQAFSQAWFSPSRQDRQSKQTFSISCQPFWHKPLLFRNHFHQFLFFKYHNKTSPLNKQILATKKLKKQASPLHPANFNQK